MGLWISCRRQFLDYRPSKRAHLSWSLEEKNGTGTKEIALRGAYNFVLHIKYYHDYANEVIKMGRKCSMNNKSGYKIVVGKPHNGRDHL
jgi:hypothetical protein